MTYYIITPASEGLVPEAWMDQAACGPDDARVFDYLDMYRAALALCAACPVLAECRERGDRLEKHAKRPAPIFGVVGGETPYQRTMRRRGRPVDTDVLEEPKPQATTRPPRKVVREYPYQCRNGHTIASAADTHHNLARKDGEVFTARSCIKCAQARNAKARQKRRDKAASK